MIVLCLTLSRTETTPCVTRVTVFVHASSTRQLVHYWDAFHYFVGAKYLPELGYTGLYESAWVAGREVGAFADIAWIRDLPTYGVRDVRSIDPAAVRARFTEARWQAFKADLLVFGPRIPDWRRLFLDHTGLVDPADQRARREGIVLLELEVELPAQGIEAHIDGTGSARAGRLCRRRRRRHHGDGLVVENADR